MQQHKAIFNWSGGKDSSFCLYKILKEGKYDVQYLLTTLSSEFRRISQHGVRETLLEKQAESIGIPLYKLFLSQYPTMEMYDEMMRKTLGEFSRQGIDISIFGDIFLEDLRKYRESKLSEAGFKGVFPLWKIPTVELATEFIRLGFKAITVCVDERVLDQSFAGRIIDEDFLNDLPENVDPCGENGEYHSFVFDGPIFKDPVAFEKGEIVYKQYTAKVKDDNGSDLITEKQFGFWFCDLVG